ncbi:hypothetical protein N9X64_00415 [bacterium]|nr:hypothetical protein [bacterium]
MHSTARPKMAVFDLDKTLFDLSRRERAARRQGLKEGSDKWYEFLNQNKYILMDTAIPGTVAFVKALSENGYTIAYLSGRPSSSSAATKQSLQESSFPIDALEQDLVFLHSGKGSIRNITTHKKTVLTHLKNRFDIHFFFDDTPEFREAAKSLFIPGVYSSVASYTGKEERPSVPKKTKSKKPRNNPSELRCPEHGMVNYDQIETIEQGAIHPFTGEAVSSPVLIHKGCGLDIKAHGNVKLNPPPMPRKKRDKGGNMRKEPIKKYTERFMGDKKMNEEFPDRGQRFVVALSYARKFYSDAAVNKAYPPKSNPIGPFKKKEKPSATVLQGVSLYREIAGDNADGWADDREVGADIDWGYMEELFPLAKYLEGTLSIDYYDINGIKLKDFDTLKEAVNSYEIRMKKLYAKDPKKYPWLKDIRYFDYDEVNTGFAEGHPSGRSNYSVIFTKRNLKRFQKLLDGPKNNPRSNPHTPVHEAKEMYKQFHQKAPKNVEKKKVDFGDTWVGLGKAWSIGYRSGKETGNETQKYIHNFGVDEESGKHFKEPELYYVKNNDGSQMMVIMGGDWYIDVDEEGKMSWIYV